MPVMTIGPAEFASLLDDYAKDLVKDLPVPVDQEMAPRVAVRLMAFRAIQEKAGTFRALARQFELQSAPLETRAVPFVPRVPRGAGLS